MKPETILFGPWLPDQPDFGNPGCITAENVIPRTKNTYSPMPSFAAISSTAIPDAPLGAFSATDASGNPGMYTGTETKLYRSINATQPNFVDASGASTFATPAGRFWSFAEGDGFVYASNGVDAIQSVATGAAANFAALGANAPKAKVIASVQPGFLVCGDINDVTVGIQPQGIRWSALGDYTNFPLVGSAAAKAVQSDWQAVRADGRLQAIAPNLASCNAALFFEQSVFRMLYTGDNKIFDIQPVEKMRGTPSPRSVVQVGQMAYFLGHDGWYSFDGTLARPIGADRVNRTFYADADPNYISGIVGCADPISGLCFWLYAGTGNSGGVPNRILVYNPVVDRFSPITGFQGYSLFIGRSFGTTLDGIDALGYTIDTLPYSLDSQFLTGGKIVLGAFGVDRKYGSFSGSAMAYTMDTKEFRLSGNRRTRLHSVRPIVQGGACSAAIASRRNLDDPVAFGSASPRNNIGICPVRSEGLHQRVRLTAPAGTLAKHIQGVEVEHTPGGSR
jgi:hypothetical protein